MILFQRPLITNDILSLINRTPLIAEFILWSTKKIVFPFCNFRFLFHRKNKIPCSYSALFVSPNPCTPIQSNLYLSNSLETFVSDPDPKKLFRFQLYQPRVTKTASISDYVVRIVAWLVENELKITSKKVDIAKFQIISRHSQEGT